MFIWEPVASQWGRDHHSLMMPPDVIETSEKNGRYLLFLKYALLCVILFLLAGEHPWSVVRAASHSRGVPSLVIVGAVGGVSLFVCKRLLILPWPSLSASERTPLDSSGEAILRTHPYLRGPVLFWLATFLAGGAAEEFWRAVCIGAFQQNDYSPILAILLTAPAFSVAHASGMPPRLPGGLAHMGVEIIIGSVLGLVFVWSGSLLSLWIASVIYYTSDFYWLRRRHEQPAPAR